MLRRFSHLIDIWVIYQGSEAFIFFSGEVDGTVTV